MSPAAGVLNRVELGTTKSGAGQLALRVTAKRVPGLEQEMTPPVNYRNRRPQPPYNPEREPRPETGVLVFYDVPPDEWATTPRGIDFAGWSAETTTAAARVEELRQMPYGDYLQTPEWFHLRRLVLERAGRACERCGKTECEWNVHHLTYERRGHERLEDLVLLCRHCHETAHGIEHH